MFKIIRNFVIRWLAHGVTFYLLVFMIIHLTEGLNPHILLLVREQGFILMLVLALVFDIFTYILKRNFKSSMKEYELEVEAHHIAILLSFITMCWVGIYFLCYYLFTCY